MTGHSIRTYLNKSRDKSEGPLFRSRHTTTTTNEISNSLTNCDSSSSSLYLSLSLSHTHARTHNNIYIYVFAQQYFIQNQLLLKPNLKFKILNTSDYYGSTTPDAV